MVDRERCRQLIWLTWGLLRDGLTSVGGGPEGGGALGQTLGEDRVRVIGQVDGRHRAPAWGNRESAAHTGSHRDTSCSVTAKPFPLPPPHTLTLMMNELTHWDGTQYTYRIYISTLKHTRTHTACLLTARVPVGTQTCFFILSTQRKPSPFEKPIPFQIIYYKHTGRNMERDL